MDQYEVIAALSIDTGFTTTGAAGKHIGKLVTVGNLEVGKPAILLFDDWNVLHTSSVEEYSYYADGSILINTRNTQYVLRKQ